MEHLITKVRETLKKMSKMNAMLCNLYFLGKKQTLPMTEATWPSWEEGKKGVRVKCIHSKGFSLEIVNNYLVFVTNTNANAICLTKIFSLAKNQILLVRN